MENSDVLKLNRRQFMESSLLAVFAGLTITVVGCDDDNDNVVNPGTGAIAGVISGNHGHTAVITQAQRDAGTATTVTLTMATTDGHTHTLSLTQQNLTDINAGRTVTVTSSETEAHTHEVTFS